MQNLCNYSKEEIEDALTLLKEICEKNDCQTCPFYNGTVCAITDRAPSFWALAGTDRFYKAFAF